MTGDSVSTSSLTTLIMPPTLRWEGDPWTGSLILLDQTRLPGEVATCRIDTVTDLVEAIRSLRVRGAPAIGVSAGYGVVLGMRAASDPNDLNSVHAAMTDAVERLAVSRPTAVNLVWALRRVRERVESLVVHQTRAQTQTILARDLIQQAWLEAVAIHQDDMAMCLAIGRHGADWIDARFGNPRPPCPRLEIITHCNAGALATSDHGTALAIVYEAHRRGRDLAVLADETRPLLQGARLTAWELSRRGIPVTVIGDGMAAALMSRGRGRLVIVGADRIAANGDVANKIGTYALAIVARRHGLPFVVAAPSSTFDLTLTDGSSIPIEQRDPAELIWMGGKRIVPEGVAVENPAFDVTPAELIDAIVTERGVIEPVKAATVQALIA